MSSQQTLVHSAREGKLFSKKGNTAKSAQDLSAITASNMQMSNPSSKATKIQAVAQDTQKPTAWVETPLGPATVTNMPDSGKKPNEKSQQASNGSAATNVTDDSGGALRPIPVAKVTTSQSAPAISKGHELIDRGARTAQRCDDDHCNLPEAFGKCSSPNLDEQRSVSDDSGGRMAQEVNLRQAPRAFKKVSKDSRKPQASSKRSTGDRQEEGSFQLPISAKRRAPEVRDAAYPEPVKTGSVAEETPGLRKGFMGSGLVGGNNKEALPARTFDANREDEIIALIEDHQKERLRTDPLRELDEALMDRTTASLNRRLKDAYKHVAGRLADEPLSPTFIEIDLERQQAVRVISQAEAERHQELANRMLTSSEMPGAEDVDMLAEISTAARAGKQHRQQECSVTKAKRLRKHEDQRHRSDAREQCYEVDADRALRPGAEPPEFGESSGKERYELEDIARRKSQRVRRPLFRQFDQDALEEPGQRLDRQIAQQYGGGASATTEHKHGTRSKTRLGRAFDGVTTANSNGAAGRASDYFQTSLGKTSIKLPRKRAVNQSQSDEQCNASRKVAGHRSSPGESEGMRVGTTAYEAHGSSARIDDVGSGGDEQFNEIDMSGRFDGNQAHMSASDDPQGQKLLGADAQRRKRWLKAGRKGRGDLGARTGGGAHIAGSAWGKVSNELDSDDKNNKGRFQLAQSAGGGHANQDLHAAYLSQQAAGAHVAATGEGACLQDGEQADALDLDASSHEITDDNLVNRIQVTNGMHDMPNQASAKISRPSMTRGPQTAQGSLPHYAAGGTSDSNEPSSGGRAYPKNDQYREQISPLRKSLQQAFLGTRIGNKTKNNPLRTPKRATAHQAAGSPASTRDGKVKAGSRPQGARSGDTPQNLQQINPINRYSPAVAPATSRPNTGRGFSKPQSRQLTELISFAQQRSTVNMHALSCSLLRMLPPPERNPSRPPSSEKARRRSYSFGQTLRKLIALTNMISVHQPPVPPCVPCYPMAVVPSPLKSDFSQDNQPVDAIPAAPTVSLQQMLQKALGPQDSYLGSQPALPTKGKCDSQGFVRPENVIRTLDTSNQGQPAAKRHRAGDQ